MLTEMALSSDRMRFKDKIIANIAKAIKGIQEAVFFKTQTAKDESPLVLRNSDRQCHKLCENLDHVFLHGLRQHSHGYWKVVTEYTHKNAVREIKNLRNVTTDLGRGRAWIFMALNDSLLESYIRCITEHTKILKKHYVKDALLLDQQQMSVLLTLTSGLECAVFQLEYDLPYLDLTAYPPRTRTASKVEEEEEQPYSAVRSLLTAASNPASETAASTPESAKALTDSDTASLSSLDTPALRSARISSVSVDSGFPGDILSNGNQQRSVTPIDAVSVSSHGSAGELDRLTRLENIVTDMEGEVEGGGLEVIRVKGGKKSALGAKKKKAMARKLPKGTISQGAQAGASGDVVEPEPHTPTAPIRISKTTSAVSLEEEKSALGGDSPSGSCAGNSADSPCKEGDVSTDIVVADQALGSRVERDSASSRSRAAERLAAETKDSLADGFAQLDTKVASIRATTTTLHQPSALSQSVPCSVFHECSDSTFCPSSYKDIDPFPNSATAWDNVVTDMKPMMEQNVQVPENAEDYGSTMLALQELEIKCAELCQPLSPQDACDDGRGDGTSATQTDSERKSPSSLSRAPQSLVSCSNVKSADSALKSAGDGKTHGESTPEHRCTEEEGEEDEVDFYGSFDKAGILPSSSCHSVGQLQDYMDYISGHHNEILQSGQKGRKEEGRRKEVDVEGNGTLQERTAWSKDYALRLDNNTKLQIMLDIFSRDDEEFLKLFVSREGHSEGEQKVTFVLVTSYALYLLRQRDSDRKFETELSFPLKDLSFITLSLNKQIMNIESTGPSRRKERVWLTPGDHLLAQQILDCLQEAMKGVQQPLSVRSHFSVGSDEPLQIIALRKYIARDSNYQEDEVQILDYSLVFWEDTQGHRSKPMATAREGTMLLKGNDPFKGHVWKPVYVVLRDFMLCVFADKADSKPQQYIRLGGEQCVGCRLATSVERPHCIEIILAKGGSWYLSVASAEEAASWRHSLCLAVSEGMQDSSSLNCLPCVSVVTGQKLLLCHEDVQTKFCRTIASARVEEITALTVDPEVNRYCVVEFESQESGVVSECWVLYFNSPLEMERFVKALSSVWKQVYQIPLSAGSIQDLPLQKHCQDQVTLLQRATTMK